MLSNYPWAFYYVSNARESFDIDVRRGYVDDSEGGISNKSSLFKSKWLRKPLPWEGIKVIGEQMLDEIKKDRSRRK